MVWTASWRSCVFIRRLWFVEIRTAYLLVFRLSATTSDQQDQIRARYAAFGDTYTKDSKHLSHEHVMEAFKQQWTLWKLIVGNDPNAPADFIMTQRSRMPTEEGTQGIGSEH